MSCVKSREGASISKSIGLYLGRGAGGPAEGSPDSDADCAIAELGGARNRDQHYRGPGWLLVCIWALSDLKRARPRRPGRPNS